MASMPSELSKKKIPFTQWVEGSSNEIFTAWAGPISIEEPQVLDNTMPSPEQWRQILNKSWTSQKKTIDLGKWMYPRSRIVVLVQEITYPRSTNSPSSLTSNNALWEHYVRTNYRYFEAPKKYEYEGETYLLQGLYRRVYHNSRGNSTGMTELLPVKVSPMEGTYLALVAAHNGHRGRDATFAQLGEWQGSITKGLVSEFIKHCPNAKCSRNSSTGNELKRKYRSLEIPIPQKRKHSESNTESPVKIKHQRMMDQHEKPQVSPSSVNQPVTPQKRERSESESKSEVPHALPGNQAPQQSTYSHDQNYDEDYDDYSHVGARAQKQQQPSIPLSATSLSTSSSPSTDRTVSTDSQSPENMAIDFPDWDAFHTPSMVDQNFQNFCQEHTECDRVIGAAPVLPAYDPYRRGFHTTAEDYLYLFSDPWEQI